MESLFTFEWNPRSRCPGIPTYSANGLNYDVAPDGRRFVMIDESEAEPAPTQLVLVQNWATELERLVPTGN